jgi:two-component system, OmpR family, sensor histidine kinase KdpD
MDMRSGNGFEFMLRRWSGYAWAAIAAVLCTLIGWAMEPRFHPVNIAMVYLLAVVVVSLRYSRGAAIACAVLAVAAFNFFFIPPQQTFMVEDPQYLLTFAIMLTVALVISRLKTSIRQQTTRQGALEVEAETERIRSALLASISHDLRTPLAIMSGASSILAEEADLLSKEERAALARSVFDQSREMSDQMSKILQMTRLETGAITIERDWNSLPEIAGAVLRKLHGKLAHHRVIVDLPVDLPLVRVDAALIDQVLSNLLENAGRYTLPGTLVRLRAQLQAGELVVSVEDFGAGLSPQEFDRIFSKFYRSRPEAGATGTGLGLSICRAIVHLHGGRIWAEQLPGGATALRFTLPLETVPEVPAESIA